MKSESYRLLASAQPSSHQTRSICRGSAMKGPIAPARRAIERHSSYRSGLMDIMRLMPRGLGSRPAIAYMDDHHDDT
jgi:hypothetical protein